MARTRLSLMTSYPLQSKIGERERERKRKKEREREREIERERGGGGGLPVCGNAKRDTWELRNVKTV